MGCHHHAAMHPLGAHWPLRTVVEAAHSLALLSDAGADRVAGADGLEPEEERAPCNLCRPSGSRGQPGPQARLPCRLVPRSASLACSCESWWAARERPRASRAWRSCARVVPIARVSKGAEPLGTVGLADDRAGPHDFPSLAPGGERRHRCHLTDRWAWWQLFCLGKSARARSRAGAIEIEDDPRGSLSVHQTPWWPLFRERAAQQSIENQAA